MKKFTHDISAVAQLCQMSDESTQENDPIIYLLQAVSEPGKEIYAIVKAPSVMLSCDVNPKKISARNVLQGTENRIEPGAVNDEVTIDIAGSNTVTSILTSESVRSLDLKVGAKVSAIIKASSVLLAIT